MDMGLLICRSIIEAREGRLWAFPGIPGWHGILLYHSTSEQGDMNNGSVAYSTSPWHF
jgi:hypothetical protein